MSWAERGATEEERKGRAEKMKVAWWTLGIVALGPMILLGLILLAAWILS